MSAHILPLPTPLPIDMDDALIERTISIEKDDAGQVWIFDQTWNDGELEMQTTRFPTPEAAEAFALRLLAVARSGSVVQ